MLTQDKYYSTMDLPHVKLYKEKIVNVDDTRIVTTAGTSPNIDVKLCSNHLILCTEIL